MKLFPQLNQSFLRRATNFWTFVFFIVIIGDFITENSFDRAGLILLVAIFYTAFLAIYSAEKEFKRWHESNKTMHPGEMYVVIWTILIVGLLAANLYLKEKYELPAEVRASYIVVIGILAITKESKYLYKQKKKR